ncbi:hypothetical protein PFMALIP_05013 [Plasmodium falciparum MaliPS096_E11]|uniref:Uncharacterized protein n=1 Tax=Plasmodium falciparum MaliPS096_E11 TaxID=1036727 RepID=A0A024WK13_PLAFA|nr:hypothetical protein PFMALIP_05013 [Plasmodium falciparum MaliPS096_E11]
MANNNMDDINLECENDNDNKISSEKRLVDDIIENNIRLIYIYHLIFFCSLIYILYF